MRHLLLILLCAVASAAESSPANALSLDGTWRFRTTTKDGDWRPMPVPGCWNTFDALADFVGVGVYERQVSIPAAWAGKHIELQCDAAYESATVQWNGNAVGSHVGGYTAFACDLSRVATPGEHTLRIQVDNTYARSAIFRWSGLTRSVRLVASDPVRIAALRLRPRVDIAAMTASVGVEIEIAHDGTEALDARVDVAIAEPALTARITGPVAPGQVTTLRTSIPLTSAQVRLWRLDDPQLYRLTARLAAGSYRDERSDRFGLRQVSVDANGLTVNGERVRLAGFNRVNDHRAYGTSLPEHQIRFDIEQMKQLGCHFARIDHMPMSRAYLDALDEAGIMVISEIPVWGRDDPQVKPGNPLTTRWLHELISQQFNHPSIIGWSVGNELMQHKAYVESMLEVTRRLDPDRLHTYVSFTVGHGEKRGGTRALDPATACDFICNNVYGRGKQGQPGNASAPLGEAARNVRKEWPDKAIFYSEHGVRFATEELDADVPGIDTGWQEAAQEPYVFALSLWTYNDYRSVYKETPPSQNRPWGIVDVWRRPKTFALRMHQLHRPVAALELTDSGARLVPRRADEIPSFTLRGYRLVWEQWSGAPRSGVSSGGGAVVGERVIAGGVINVPDLAPGAAPFTAAFSHDTAAPTILSLVAPDGTVVAETRSRAAIADRFTPVDAEKPSASGAPILRAWEAVPGGAVVGFSVQWSDTAFEREVVALDASGAPNGPARSTPLEVRGATRIEDLQDGLAYRVRLRAQRAGAWTAWSEPLTVHAQRAPDSGPAQILGQVSGDGWTAVRIADRPGIVGWRLGDGAAARLHAWPRPGLLLLPAGATTPVISPVATLPQR